MSIQAYINFNGNCREAVEFYADVFQTEIPKIMLFGDMPENPSFPINDESKKLVLHTSLEISGSTIMFSDLLPGSPFIVGNNISLTIVSKNIDEIKSFFNKLKVEGTVIMDLQETFWSKCYGSTVDKFGIMWQLSLEN